MITARDLIQIRGLFAAFSVVELEASGPLPAGQPLKQEDVAPYLGAIDMCLYS